MFSLLGLRTTEHRIIQPIASTSFFAGCAVRTLARTGIDPEFCARQFQNLPALIKRRNPLQRVEYVRFEACPAAWGQHGFQNFFAPANHRPAPLKLHSHTFWHLELHPTSATIDAEPILRQCTWYLGTVFEARRSLSQNPNPSKPQIGDSNL